jgi:hypothetical protein
MLESAFIAKLEKKIAKNGALWLTLLSFTISYTNRRLHTMQTAQVKRDKCRRE